MPTLLQCRAAAHVRVGDAGARDHGTGIDRRSVVAALACAPLLASCLDFEPQPRTGAARSGPAVATRYTYLQPAEIAFVDAAVDRLIPADGLGPGAADAGVTVFIDRQLAGPYGKAADWYMAGPWLDGPEEQGYQSRLAPAQLYRHAIAAIDALCRTECGRKTFAALRPTEQDELLHALEDGKLALQDVPGKTFFKTLWQNTQEGYFADPLYGGNRGFAGWTLVGFPGPRYNYLDDIRRHGQPYTLPTVGLMGRDPARQPQEMP